MNVNETAKLLGELQMLAYLINENTDYAVFTEFAGHVKEWTVRICASKTNYTEGITSDGIYIKPEVWGDPTEKLKTMKLQLEKILNDKKISYNELNCKIREEQDYSLI